MAPCSSPSPRWNGTKSADTSGARVALRSRYILFSLIKRFWFQSEITFNSEINSARPSLRLPHSHCTHNRTARKPLAPVPPPAAPLAVIGQTSRPQQRRLGESFPQSKTRSDSVFLTVRSDCQSVRPISSFLIGWICSRPLPWARLDPPLPRWHTGYLTASPSTHSIVSDSCVIVRVECKSFPCFSVITPFICPCYGCCHITLQSESLDYHSSRYASFILYLWHTVLLTNYSVILRLELLYASIFHTVSSLYPQATNRF